MVEKSTRTHRSGKWRHTNEKRQKKRSHPVCRKSRMVEKEMGFYVPQNSTGVSKVGDVCGPGNVEVIENRVTVCRDAVKGACMRPQCKYYHIPVALPPAPLMAIAAPATP
ncbi:hypothetical protein HZH66_001537 [Vespula vulgaris]|uniref:C3H1-type domain-containing protein n=1 Tax=Vespula vulgaris TaxID=7454 RepID=A0A834KTA2_VESVU|nr:hypothetical protein HZH66_001537 [Vespula vulgaris]